MALGATYTPIGGIHDFVFGMLVARPTRSTSTTVSERMPPGSNISIVDVIGKPVTKIINKARIDSYSALKTLEGLVGTTGTLVYAEGTFNVEFVSVKRAEVTPQGIQLFDAEFWIVP